MLFDLITIVASESSINLRQEYLLLKTTQKICTATPKQNPQIFSTLVPSINYLERGRMRTAHLLRATLLLVFDAFQLWNALIVERRRHQQMSVPDGLARHANVRPVFGERSASAGVRKYWNDVR